MYTTGCSYTQNSSRKNTIDNSREKVDQEVNTSLLLQQVSLGNVNAFWKLWMHYQNYLYHHCLRWMGNNWVDAEDVLSRAMLVAWEKLKKYASTIANIKAWLTRLTYNTCMNVWRERRKEFGADLVEQIINRESCSLPAANKPEDALLMQELEVVIHQLVAKLPLNLYQPFVLRFCDSWSYPEIGSHLNITYATARKRIQQARDILRQQLVKYLDGDRIELCLETPSFLTND